MALSLSQTKMLLIVNFGSKRLCFCRCSIIPQLHPATKTLSASWNKDELVRFWASNQHCKQRCLHTAAWRAFMFDQHWDVQIPKFLVRVSTHYRGNYRDITTIPILLFTR